MVKIKFNDDGTIKKIDKVPQIQTKKDLTGHPETNGEPKKVTSQDSKSSNKSQQGSKTSGMLIQPLTKWYKQKETISKKGFDGTNQISPDRERELKEEAAQLMEADKAAYRAYQEQPSRRGDFFHIRSIIRNGTVKDKIAAHITLIQDSPLHNLDSVDSLISMCESKGHREIQLSLETLRDLFIGDLLIPKSKLKTFKLSINDIEGNFNLHLKQRNKLLLLAYFESELKTRYQRFLNGVERVSREQIEALKNKAVNTMFDLLVANPEQEQYLLEKLVNKLGDPCPKLASHASNLLIKLVNFHHPAMKTVVVEEVERLLFRPNIRPKAQYYSLCFLGQVILSKVLVDENLANKLVQIYLDFFKANIKKGEVDNKMMAALLTGINRAIPYSKMGTEKLAEDMDTFYKVIHQVNQSTRIQALSVLFSVLDTKENGALSDRFYQVLYGQLLEIDLDNCHRKAAFLNLIYRAIKRDPIIKRVKAMIKRLLQVAHRSSSAVACAILMILCEAIKQRPALSIAKTVKLQKIAMQDEEEDDSGDEKYHDVPEDDESSHRRETGETSGQGQSLGSSKAASWVHSKNLKESSANPQKLESEAAGNAANLNNASTKSRSSSYDPSHRNPLYCNAEFVPFWEMTTLCQHFHPSVAIYAQQLVSNKLKSYPGDPLTDFTIKHFLDRFVFRNPKPVSLQAKATARQRSVFGRLAALKARNKPISEAEKIGSNAYINSDEKRIPLEERFIFKYLKDKKERIGDYEGDSDIESVTSEQFEEILDKTEFGDVDKDFATEFKAGRKKQLEMLKKAMRQKGFDEDDFGEARSRNAPDEEYAKEDVGSDVDMEGDDEDDEMEFDSDDEEFNEAFGDVKEELQEALAEYGDGLDDDDLEDGDNEDGYDDYESPEDSDEEEKEEEEDEKPLRPKRCNKKGFDKRMNSLFASADEFAHILNQNEAGADDEDSDYEGAIDRAGMDDDEDDLDGLGVLSGKPKADAAKKASFKKQVAKNKKKYDKMKRKKALNPVKMKRNKKHRAH